RAEVEADYKETMERGEHRLPFAMRWLTYRIAEGKADLTPTLERISREWANWQEEDRRLADEVNEARDRAKLAYREKLGDEGRDFKFISAKMTEKFGDSDVVEAPVCAPLYWPEHIEREQWRMARVAESRLAAQFSRPLPVQATLRPVSKKCEPEPPT